MSRTELDRHVETAREAANQARAKGDEIAEKFFLDCVEALHEDWEHEHGCKP